ncbi:zinc-dependent alcohol dehydrogenase [Neopusillimonas aromaticivorans]|uniref:zinc-dependent alcohol dehydrogenase n=1 Tax=Neopusillimonas aromaticivorans TaxID=2979868 RepID=UPI002595CDB3|nr:alcohol dehydrogenase catalytic domain-containing protein [Neopusillimonas aromaticivorans]WJJ94497.1 alcohol dehydrogenase catalytic domain-containing protein [Neopusillimonas aromaticivorans]
MLKVRAAVKVGVEQTEIQEFDRPVIPPEAGLLRVESSGVGGSDPELYRKPDHAPIIMGHENVGTIEELGPVAAARWGVRQGDRVALHEYLPCWHCEWCMKGDFRLCMEVDFFNVKDRLNTLRFGMSSCNIEPHLWGAMPSTCTCRRTRSCTRFRKICRPSGRPWPCLSAMVCSGPALMVVRVQCKTVLIFGPGQQGLGCTLAAKAAGSICVILVGMTRDRARLDLALRMGADHVIDAQEEDLHQRVMALTGGRGVDVVVDTTGDPTGQVVNDAVALAAKGAYLSLNGLEQHVPIKEIKKRYLTVRAPRGRSYGAVELALRYIGSGKYPINEVCSHDYGLDQVHDAILATAGRGVSGAIHVTVNPWR